MRHPDHLVLALQKPRLRLGVVKAVLLVLGPRHVGHEGGHVAASLVQIHRRALRPLGVHAVVGGNVRKTPVTFYLASKFFFNIFRTEQATLDPREYAKREKLSKHSCKYDNNLLRIGCAENVGGEISFQVIIVIIVGF